MRDTRVFRILGVVIILSLLVMAIPATPAQAARTITVTPSQGSIGSEITIAGEGFSPSTTSTDKYVNIYFSSDEASVGQYINTQVKTYKTLKFGVWVDYQGNLDINKSFTVPAQMNDGSVDADVVAGKTYYIYVTREYTDPNSPATIIGAVAQFTVVGGEITLDPTEGPVATEVEITGTDFSREAEITVKYDGATLEISDGDSQTDADGGFISYVLIPESTAGAHTLTVVVDNNEVSADFTVEPEILLSPTSGEAGTEVTVSGTGFGRRKDVVVYFNNVGVATVTASSKGSFEASFKVPKLEADIYDVEAEDEDGNLDAAKFTVTVPPPPSSPPPAPAPAQPPPPPTAVNISSTSGSVGTDIVITGAGFEAGSTITVKYDGEKVATVEADSNGIFLAMFKVPVSKHGDHTITISDGTNTEELTFTVESEAPPTPTPLSPEMGVNVKPPISFDWEDVTDPSSPVTYTLQIATSASFSANSLVLEKTGLDTSEYTLTEKEAMEIIGREAPYYWRVRAVDSASNEGEWTGAGEFYVTRPFRFPDWALYTLLGVGGLVLFAIGYWMGRRTAYYY